MRTLTRFLPAALVAALLVAGCGSGESTESTTPGGGGAETTQAHQSGAEGPYGITARPCRHIGETAAALRVTGVSCSKGVAIAEGWASRSGCAPAAGDSRSACTVAGFRCLTAVAGQGLAVTCARPERSVAFLVERG
jgi:hypothetical protein